VFCVVMFFFSVNNYDEKNAAVSRNKLKMRNRKVRDVPYRSKLLIFFKITFFYVATYAAICIVYSLLLVKTRPECPPDCSNL
jgi:hypothetical protein